MSISVFVLLILLVRNTSTVPDIYLDLYISRPGGGRGVEGEVGAVLIGVNAILIKVRFFWFLGKGPLFETT